MGKLGIFLLVFVTIAPGSVCHDPRLRSGTVSGDVIRGSVSKNRKPVRFAQVHLFSTGKLVTTSTTDKNGMLTIGGLLPRRYELSVAGWGSVPVEVIPQPPKGQQFFDSLMLDRRGSEVCVAEVSVTN